MIWIYLASKSQISPAYKEGDTIGRDLISFGAKYTYKREHMCVCIWNVKYSYIICKDIYKNI